MPASMTCGFMAQRIIGSFVVSLTFLTHALNLSASSLVQRTAIMSSLRVLPMYSKLKFSVFCTRSTTSFSGISSVTSMAIAVGFLYVNSWRYMTSLPPIFLAFSPTPTVTSLTAGFSRSFRIAYCFAFSGFSSGLQLSSSISRLTIFVANAMQLSWPHSLQLVFGKFL